jgi:hypothetical protein
MTGGLFLMAGERVAQAGPTPSLDDWDNNLHGAARFTVLAAFGNAAVRDNNTGLVWERAPDASSQIWSQARYFCGNRNVGGTVGWRLPSVVELRSVQDPSLPAPFVPGTVFIGVQSLNYWTATTTAASESITYAWVVDFGAAGGSVNTFDKANALQVWCVRGGMNADLY